MVSKSSIYKYLIDIIYPNRCPVCQKIIRWDKLVCPKCEAELPYNSEKFITKIQNADYEYSPLKYEGVVKDLVYSLKLSGKAGNFAEFCAEITAAELAAAGKTEKIDLICAVPMYKGKKSARGYNQAETIAKITAKKLNKPTDFSLLLRTSDKTEQHKLSASERAVHAKKVYKLHPNHSNISGKNLLLCDDVITTGSSMNVCAKLLKQMGAKKVFCVSCAVTVPGNNL